MSVECPSLRRAEQVFTHRWACYKGRMAGKLPFLPRPLSLPSRPRGVYLPTRLPISSPHRYPLSALCCPGGCEDGFLQGASPLASPGGSPKGSPAPTLARPGTPLPSPQAPRVDLQGAELWKRFHEIGTEMIITKAGR